MVDVIRGSVGELSEGDRGRWLEMAKVERDLTWAKAGTRPDSRSRGALVALAAATGILVGLRAIVHVELPRLVPLLGLEPIPREGLGVAWSELASWPADLQAAALERLILVVTVLFLCAALVATLNGVIVLAESAAGRRGELAVRSALGASPVRLTIMMLRELRTLLLGGLGVGIVGGVAAGSAARALWPAPLATWLPLESSDLLLALLGLWIAVAAAYLAAGWQTTRKGRTAIVLRAGTRTDADPGAVFVRKVLTAGHAAIAGTVLVGAVTLASALDTGAAPGDGDGETVVYDLTAPEPGTWSPLLTVIRDVPGIEAESLAAPGALVGLGIREIAIAECGNCSRGLMPAPLWNALADHHAVAPGYVELAGLSVLEGRDFTDEDAEGAEPVALVNETFARSSFERGEPIGKRVRIGADFDAWYRVVGVVADQSVPVLGADERTREAVYLNALRRAPRHGTLLLRGSTEGLRVAEGVMSARGFDPGPGRTVGAHRAEALRELRWTYRAAVLAAVLVLLLAAHGVYAMALQTTRRRTAEVAIHRAVGATPLRVASHVLGERLRVTAWGLAGFGFFGTLIVALLRSAAGMPPPGPLTYAGVALLLSGVALVASGRAAKEALAVEPSAILD
jgi:putative ABC transport system permease protein